MSCKVRWSSPSWSQLRLCSGPYHPRTAGWRRSAWCWSHQNRHARHQVLSGHFPRRKCLHSAHLHYFLYWGWLRSWQPSVWWARWCPHHHNHSTTYNNFLKPMARFLTLTASIMAAMMESSCSWKGSGLVWPASSEKESAQVPNKKR